MGINESISHSYHHHEGPEHGVVPVLGPDIDHGQVVANPVPQPPAEIGLIELRMAVLGLPVPAHHPDVPQGAQLFVVEQDGTRVPQAAHLEFFPVDDENLPTTDVKRQAGEGAPVFQHGRLPA